MSLTYILGEHRHDGPAIFIDKGLHFPIQCTTFLLLQLGTGLQEKLVKSFIIPERVILCLWMQGSSSFTSDASKYNAFGKATAAHDNDIRLFIPCNHVFYPT